MLATTRHGKIACYDSGNEIVKNFDLKLVFNLYEEYFSDFDRFRINMSNMIFSRDQKRFGYSYVNCKEFSKYQLQEMYLKPFCFERKLIDTNNYGEKDYRYDFMNKVREYFQSACQESIEKSIEKFYSEVGC